jgi:hypothetical protein
VVTGIEQERGRENSPPSANWLRRIPRVPVRSGFATEEGGGKLKPRGFRERTNVSEFDSKS